jgi:hypothetical protein
LAIESKTVIVEPKKFLEGKTIKVLHGILLDNRPGELIVLHPGAEVHDIDALRKKGNIYQVEKRFTRIFSESAEVTVELLVKEKED